MIFARWQPYYTDRELELHRRIHTFGLLLALIATPLLLGLAAESRRPGPSKRRDLEGRAWAANRCRRGPIPPLGPFGCRFLKPKDVWAARVRLQLEEGRRDLALFDLALESNLRGCDLVRLQVSDMCVGGRVRDRAAVIQRKTGRPVQFEITEQTE